MLIIQVQSPAVLSSLTSRMVNTLKYSTSIRISPWTVLRHVTLFKFKQRLFNKIVSQLKKIKVFRLKMKSFIIFSLKYMSCINQKLLADGQRKFFSGLYYSFLRPVSIVALMKRR